MLKRNGKTEPTKKLWTELPPLCRCDVVSYKLWDASYVSSCPEPFPSNKVDDRFHDLPNHWTHNAPQHFPMGSVEDVIIA
ncbi:hypothetical protein TNCV_3159711 [Trichonephila clavipes]|nr:hypothetical protein TNCV_3159711 [Trichonephila clavipes]